MKKPRLSGFVVTSLVGFIILFPTFVSATGENVNVPRVDVNISEAGVVDAFSVACTGTDATAILTTNYPFLHSPAEYMRRPCLNGLVTFDSFDLGTYILNESGTVWPYWLQWYKPPYFLIIKNTSTLVAPDAPNYIQIVKLPNTTGEVLSAEDNTYPTIAVGSSFNYDSIKWVKIPPSTYVPIPPPEPIGDPNNLNARITPAGDVPRVSINCTPGNDYTLSLVHRSGELVSFSFGVKQRKLCPAEGVVSFDGFNMNTLLVTEKDAQWWRYVRTPLEYIIKDTTGLFSCWKYNCPLISLESSANNFDRTPYLASSTVWTTVGKGPIFQVDETFSVWSNVNVPPPPAPTGNSSVMFFPGVMSSRLYEEVGTIDCGVSVVGNECLRDNELWVSTSDTNHQKLSLDTYGKSIHPVYTKDDTRSISDEAETGITDEVYGTNIYNTFINSLRNWKQDGTIPDYAFIPYDWRLSLNDIVVNGASTSRNKLDYSNSKNFSDSYILKKLQELQKNSGIGKVTLIGHSNGGLVIKALVQKLKDTNNPLYNQIDKIILVAVPQVGTPDALVMLLHGKPLGSGIIMNNARARDIAKNMPAIYNLLPSAGYFDTVSFPVSTSSVITFEDNALYSRQLAEYGFIVSNNSEFKDYILGTDGRSAPAYSDIVKPNIGNAGLYTDAENIHAELASWQPSTSTKVVQIAGWGVETIAGLDYVTRKSPGGRERMSYKPRKVVDGDGTVVTPSALWMSTSNQNVERWWVDLWKFNDNNSPDRVHRNILEISDVNDLIRNEIDGNFDQNYTYVKNSESDMSTNEVRSPRLHYTLHSPLTLGVTDLLGRYTGLDPVTGEVREEIPDVVYEQMGDVQFLSVPSNTNLTLKMQGKATGSFALDVDKQTGNIITENTSFQAIPSDVSTKVEMNIVPDMSVASSTLKIDQNGDGLVDKTLLATQNSVTVYDITPPELQVTFSTSTKDVVLSAVDNIDSNPIIFTTSTSTTLTDIQGNTTIIPFTKLRESSTRFRFSYNRIIRNGLMINLPNTNIIFDWQEKKDVLSDLDTRVNVKGVERYVFNYRKSNNSTIVRERVGNSLVTTIKPGFVVVTTKTEGDLLKVSY